MTIPTTNFSAFVNGLVSIISMLFSLCAALALVLFFYGVFQYVYGASNATTQKAGKTTMTWGLVGLVVMVFFAGIVRIFATTLFGNSL